MGAQGSTAGEAIARPVPMRAGRSAHSFAGEVPMPERPKERPPRDRPREPSQGERPKEEPKPADEPLPDSSVAEPGRVHGLEGDVYGR